MKALKIVSYIFGGVIALVCIALVSILLFVNPNDYRDNIAQLVEQQTGRKLTLSGDLKLSVFPWLALQTGPAALSDAPKFSSEPFISIQQASVGARLWPLLLGRVEVGKVLLQGARIHLITDADGHNNWDDLGKQSDTSAAAQKKESAQLPTIAGIEITDAGVTLENRKEKSTRVISNFNFTTGRLAAAEPFAVKTEFVLQQDPSSIKVKFTSTVNADMQQHRYEMSKPDIDLTLSGPGYPADGLSVKLKAAALNVNLAKQTLELPGLEAEVAGAHLSGALAGTQIVDAPKFSGPLQLATLSPRDWLPKLGIQLPPTRDAQTFKSLSFAGQLALSGSAVQISNIVVTLDDTTARGSLGIADFATKALRFDLNVDRINADRYLSPPVAKPKGVAAEKQPPTEIPVDLLRTLNARGQLAIGDAIFSGLKFSKLRLGINAQSGQIRFSPSEASMYGGQYHGDIGIDATGLVARISLDEHVNEVNFAPLFKDFFDTTRFSGKGNATIRLTGSGRTTDEVMQTLNGSVDFKVVDGALEGTDLLYEIRRARALFKQQAIPDRAGPPRTVFSALQGTGKMTNGVLINNDLQAAMPLLKIMGQGSVDMPHSTLDYKLVVAVLRMPREDAAAPLQDMVDAQIPVKVTGSLSDPKVRPDLEGYVKEEVKKRVDEERGKLEDKVKEKLGDKLKDLFGR
jgi:AsmA protein